MSNINNLVDSTQGISVTINLPFHFRTISETDIDLTTQNQMAFDIVEAFEQSDVVSSHEQAAQTRHLENKLNTVLKLLRLLLSCNESVPSDQSLHLSSSIVQWSEVITDKSPANKLKENQDIEVSIYPTNQLPWPIKRLARIIKLNKDKVQAEITAQFYPVDEISNERFEKWIFRLHRQYIRQHKN